MTSLHDAEMILLYHVMMPRRVSAEMSRVDETTTRRYDEGLHPVAVMIRRAVGMFIPGGAMILLAVGIALPVREMTDHMGWVSSPTGVMARLVDMRTPPGDGPSPHDAEMTSEHFLKLVNIFK